MSRLRNRMVKGDFWTDPTMKRWPILKRVFYQSLWAMAEDRLHEPYRVGHLPQLPDLVAAARAAGALGAALSGAGSAVLALADDAQVAERVAAQMSAAAQRTSLAGRAVVVRPAARGAHVVRAHSS